MSHHAEGQATLTRLADAMHTTDVASTAQPLTSCAARS